MKHNIVSVKYDLFAIHSVARVIFTHLWCEHILSTKTTYVLLDPYLQLTAKQNSLHADNVHFIRKPEESNTSPAGGWFVKWLPTELQASTDWREPKTESGV